jgi:hypothetical protein
LRLNLDSEGDFTDAQLYEALSSVQLIAKRSTPTASESSSTGTLVDLNEGDHQPKDITIPVKTSMFENLDFEITQGGEK